MDVSLLEDWPSENGCFIQDPVNTSRVKDCVPLLIFRNGCSTCSMTRSHDGGRIDTMADESAPSTSETPRRRQFLRVPVSLPVLGRAPQFPGEALRGMVLNVKGFQAGATLAWRRGRSQETRRKGDVWGDCGTCVRAPPGQEVREKVVRENTWCPQGDSNPRYRLEGPMS